MMTSSRPRGDVGGSFATRRSQRSHGSQLSISDPSHHVTETIGTLYGDEDYSPSDHRSAEQRPLSFVASPYSDEIHKSHSPDMMGHSDGSRRPLIRSTSDKSGQLPPNGSPTVKKSQTLPARIPSHRSNSFEPVPKSPLSPNLSLKDVRADSEGSQFPLTNIDNPNDIAQELSNLQALRRMSMDVGNNSDPDLLPFSSMSLMAMPSIAPKGDDDEGDPSRLLWVPARVHPELAPMEFKSFLENRVQSIKRRSGDSFLSAESEVDRSNSGGLRRKKSMLSRQIDNGADSGAIGYVDGAERLERKRSQAGHHTPELSLDELVKDPKRVVQKLAQDAQRPDTGSDGGMDDMPILPVAPGMGLRRSTRTTYRKGGSLRGERLPFSKRIAARQGESSGSEETQHNVPEAPKGHSLARVQSEPVAENYSRPTRSVRRQQKFSQESITAMDGAREDSEEMRSNTPGRIHQDHLSVRRPTPESEASSPAVPHIIETPAPDDEGIEQPGQPHRPYPQRSSSQKAAAQMAQQHYTDEPPAKSSKRPGLGRPLQTTPITALQQTSPKQSAQTLDDIASQPSPLPGSGAGRTDALTFIPTISPDEKKSDRKSRKEKDDDSSSTTSTKAAGWNKWFKYSDSEKKKREDDGGKKSKAKALVEKAQDNVRLDVLQTSIETAVAKGRESLLLDRDSIDNKLQEERKKESNRKSDSKKEKDGSIFSSLFGGGKKKSEKDGASKKGHHLRVSEDPPYRPLRPDIDYHWTRFPLLEERAIYRMAHIKLANPRRSLHSQVLLSNFMYNYLAIVQAMHPQMQIPVSPQQKRLDEERRRKEEEEQYLAEQHTQEDGDQDNIDRYNFEYHRGPDGQYVDGAANEGVDYVEDAEIYEYEHDTERDDGQEHEEGYHNRDGYGHRGGKDYYSYGHHNGDDGKHDTRDNMW